MVVNGLNCSASYLFGSKVYGTAGPDSDTDVVLVLEPEHNKPYSKSDDGDIHFQVYTHEEWLLKVKNHDIQALECIFYSNPWMVEDNFNYAQYFELDKTVLRESISTIANNSFVKGKKKLIISGDYDKKAGMKSVFHSIRILRFGIQVARTGKIWDYSEINWLWWEIAKLGEKYDSDILWSKINEKYKPLFNATSSEFKSLAPKNMNTRDKSRVLKGILEKNGIFSQELHDEIWAVFE